MLNSVSDVNFNFNSRYDSYGSDSSSLANYESTFFSPSPSNTLNNYQNFGNQFQQQQQHQQELLDLHPDFFKELERQLFYGQQERCSYSDRNFFDSTGHGNLSSELYCGDTVEDKDLFLIDDSGSNESTGHTIAAFTDQQGIFLLNDFLYGVGSGYNINSWKAIHPESWSFDDVFNFIYSLANEGNLPPGEIRGEAFQNLTGYDLSRMSVEDFETRDPNYGSFIHGAFRKLLEEGTFVNFPQGEYQLRDYPCLVPTVVANISGDDDTGFLRSYPSHENGIGQIANAHLNTPTDASNRLTSSRNTNAQQNQVLPRPAKRGRPPKCQSSCMVDIEQPPCKRAPEMNKAKHLWEFICHLLKNSEGMGKDRIIQWENRELGVFRIVNSKEVAILWGRHKSSNKMTFEKLSRALRWCKSSGSMADLPDDGKYPKRLCFRFGPKAVNWRTLAF